MWDTDTVLHCAHTEWHHLHFVGNNVSQAYVINTLSKPWSWASNNLPWSWSFSTILLDSRNFVYAVALYRWHVIIYLLSVYLFSWCSTLQPVYWVYALCAQSQTCLSPSSHPCSSMHAHPVSQLWFVKRTPHKLKNSARGRFAQANINLCTVLHVVVRSQTVPLAYAYSQQSQPILDHILSSSGMSQDQKSMSAWVSSGIGRVITKAEYGMVNAWLLYVLTLWPIASCCKWNMQISIATVEALHHTCNVSQHFNQHIWHHRAWIQCCWSEPSAIWFELIRCLGCPWTACSRHIDCSDLNKAWHDRWIEGNHITDWEQKRTYLTQQSIIAQW